MGDDFGAGAQAAAFLAGDRGVEGGDGGVEGVEDVHVAGLNREARLVPGGDVGADGVFFGDEAQGGGDIGGVAHEGGDGVPFVVQFGQAVVHGQAAVAGEERVAVLGLADLNGAAQAVAGNGLCEFIQGGGVHIRAITGEGGGVDGGEGDVLHGASL